jgi:hypothetical protein
MTQNADSMNGPVHTINEDDTDRPPNRTKKMGMIIQLVAKSESGLHRPYLYSLAFF